MQLAEYVKNPWKCVAAEQICFYTHILFRAVNNFTFPHLYHVPFSAPTGIVDFGGLVLPVLNLVSNFATLDGIFTVVPCGL